MPPARVCLLVLFAAISTPVQAQKQTSGGYDIRFKDHLQIGEPLRLSVDSRAASVVFHTERGWIPNRGSALHLFIRHSSTLDSSRSFLSVTLNYGLLRSFRLDKDNESSTELVIPIDADLLKDKNELVFSAQLFPLPGQDSSKSWTEITDRSHLWIATNQRAPRLDLRSLPVPLLDPNAYRDQRLDVLVSERASTETLEATSLTIANLTSRVTPRRPLVRAVQSIAGSSNPLLIVGTLEEQPELRFLRSRLSRADFVKLTTKTPDNPIPLLVVTGETAGDVLGAAHKLFEKSEVPQRDWRGFVPSGSHFALRDLGLTELRIRPGAKGAALIALNVTPDTRFLTYGMQAELTMDLGESAISKDSYIEPFLNERSMGRFSVVESSVGSQVSLRFNAPGPVLKHNNVLKIVWSNGNDRNAADGEGWILSSSEFYLPRDYTADLPDLALLQHHLYPFSLKADLSDTVVVVPDAPSEETLRGLFELAANLGRLAPSDRLAFKLRRTRELTPAITSRAHLIVLDVVQSGGKRTIVSGLKTGRGDDSLAKHPLIQQVVSPWNSNKYVLRIAPNKSDTLQNVVHRVFTEGILDRLEGDGSAGVKRPRHGGFKSSRSDETST